MRVTTSVFLAVGLCGLGTASCTSADSWPRNSHVLTSHHPWHEPPALLTAGVLMAPVLFAGATSVLFDGGEDFLQRHVAVLTWPAMVGAWVVGTAFCIAFFPLEIVAAAHNDEQTYNYVEPNPDFVPENYVPPTPDAEPMQRPD